MERIKNGEYNKVEDGYEINGRTYGVHNGRFYPISGEGLETLIRHEYQILILLVTQSENSRLFEILNNINATSEEIVKIKNILSELR